MKIRSIHIYSHDGQRRDLQFKINGLNVITGRSSTGKMGFPVSRSSTNSIPVFVACSTASTARPFRRTVTSAGGDALS